MKRFYSYHEYKMRLPSIDDCHTRYSFVVNALLAARNLRGTMMGESGGGIIINFYSDGFQPTPPSDSRSWPLSVPASRPKPQLAGEWCMAVQELCYSSVSSKSGWPPHQEVNVDDSSVHYPLATFVCLLARKYGSVPPSSSGCSTTCLAR